MKKIGNREGREGKRQVKPKECVVERTSKQTNNLSSKRVSKQAHKYPNKHLSTFDYSNRSELQDFL